MHALTHQSQRQQRFRRLRFCSDRPRPGPHLAVGERSLSLFRVGRLRRRPLPWSATTRIVEMESQRGREGGGGGCRGHSAAAS